MRLQRLPSSPRPCRPTDTTRVASGRDNSTTGARIGRWLARAPSLLAGLVLFALMTMTFFDVVLRSLFNSPIEAATELTRLFMGIVVFASLPVISWRDEHIVVDLLDSFVTGAAARVRDVVINLASGVMLMWPALRVWQLAGRAQRNGDMTEYLHIPQFYVAYFIGFATFVTAGLLIIRAVLLVAAPHHLPKRSSGTPGEKA